MPDLYTLYGAEFSLYTGKVRSYLRKKGIPFREVVSSIRVYRRFIIPRTGVRFIPVVQTPDDQVYQDTTVIIDALEQRFVGDSVYPDTSCQKLVSLLLELYGDEWLLIPAMHYRWYYRDENYRFVIGEFGRMLLPGWPGFVQRWFGRKVGSRFDAAVPMLGVSDSNRAAVEASYLALLEDLQAHFSDHDFLLGGRPTIADFGFIAPFYAHLYRDPYPGRLLRENAPAVVRWVKRMMDDSRHDGDLVANDSIPETLIPVLSRMAREQLPVLLETGRALETWRRSNPGNRIPRHIGRHAFNVDGATGERVILPYSLWQFQRPLDYYQNLGQTDRDRADRLLQQCGFGNALSTKVQNRLTRQHNRLVFADRKTKD